VRLHEIVRRQLHSEALPEVPDALRLVLAAAVGEQDEGDVVVVEKLEDRRGAGDRLRDVQQDAIDAGQVSATQVTFRKNNP
jgi:hypothetical protein